VVNFGLRGVLRSWNKLLRKFGVEPDCFHRFRLFHSANGAVMMFFVPGMNRIHAIEAASGTELWMWDPKIYERSDVRVSWEHSRGIGIRKDRIDQSA